MTEPLAKYELAEKIEKQIQAVNNKPEEIAHSQIGTIVYKLNIERETQVGTRPLKRRDFNWDSGKVDGRKKELKQSQFEITSLSLISRVVNLIRETGQSLFLPFSLYSTLLFVWIKLMTYRINRQDIRIRHKFCMRTSLYLAVTYYGISHRTMTALSVTSYSTIMVL